MLNILFSAISLPLSHFGICQIKYHAGKTKVEFVKSQSRYDKQNELYEVKLEIKQGCVYNLKAITHLYFKGEWRLIAPRKVEFHQDGSISKLSGIRILV